jgi:hypothetical protein
VDGGIRHRIGRNWKTTAMALAGWAARYRVTTLPSRTATSGLRWHAVPAVALVLVDTPQARRGLARQLAPYRVTLVPSRTGEFAAPGRAVAV